MAETKSEAKAEVVVKENTKENTKVATSEPRNRIASFDKGIYSSSDSWALACQMSKGLASSTMVPMAYQRNEGNCLIAIELANRLNISPFQVMQTLDVIQGTPAWKGKALIGFVNNSHKYDEDIHFEYEYDKDGSAISCYAWTKKGESVVKGTKYTIDMAKKAGLLSKNNSYWNKEPDLMLAYRAISRFCSLNCPEISLGLYTTDELNEINTPNKNSKASLNDALKEEDIIDIE